MWGVSLTHPELASFLLWEFLLHILIWLHFYAGSFSYTSRAVFFFLFFLSGEFLLHIPSWFHFSVGSFSYTSHDCFFCGKFLLDFPCWLHFLCGEFLIHIPWLLCFSVGNFSYTSHAGFIFMRGVSHTHLVLSTVLCKEFLLHLLCQGWLFFLSFLSGEFLLLIPSWFYLLSAEFLLHASCWLHFCFGSFSYTSRGGLIFIWVVSLTHPALSFIFIWGVSLIHPVLLCAELLLHIQETSMPSLIVSMATGGENYKIQCLSTFLSNEHTTKTIKVDVILKQSFFFCTVVSGLNLACVLLRTLKT